MMMMMMICIYEINKKKFPVNCFECKEFFFLHFSSIHPFFFRWFGHLCLLLSLDLWLIKYFVRINQSKFIKKIDTSINFVVVVEPSVIIVFVCVCVCLLVLIVYYYSHDNLSTRVCVCVLDFCCVFLSCV